MVRTRIALRISHNFRVLRINIVLANCHRLVLDTKNLHDAFAKFQCLLNRAGHAAFHIWRHYETVNDNFNIVAQVLIELWPFFKRINDAVDARTRKTFGQILLANMRERTFFLRHNRRENH